MKNVTPRNYENLQKRMDAIYSYHGNNSNNQFNLYAMKTRITTQELDYIKKKVEQYGNISICLGQLSLGMKEKLSKFFKVTKEPFGYYLFEKL